MRRFLSLLCVGLFVVSTAHSQSERKEKARQQAESGKFIIMAATKCAALRAYKPPQLIQPEESRDAQGRVITARSGTGLDYVYE